MSKRRSKELETAMLLDMANACTRAAMLAWLFSAYREERSSPLSSVLDATARGAGREARGAGRVVHCDVKPENILMQGQRVALCDFARAVHVARAWEERAYHGTIAYCSPEARLGLCGPSNGVWSVGAVLYTMVEKQTLDGAEGADMRRLGVAGWRAHLRQCYDAATGDDHRSRATASRARSKS